MSQNLMKKLLAGAAAIGAIVLAAVGYVMFGSTANQPAARPHEHLIKLAANHPSAVELASRDAAAQLGIESVKIAPGPRPQALRLPGTLRIDPSRLLHVHSRFGGEVVALGEVGENGTKRSLRYGDAVKKGQLLAVIWSKDVGEKKSELVDALSRLDLNQQLLSRLESLQTGVVAERVVVEARREVEAGLIAVAKAERTLRSWRITDEEIEAVRQEVPAIRSKQTNTARESDRKWAEIEVRAAIDGMIIEKNFNVGDIVEPADDLFKIADLSRLQVLASVYEEDLWAVRSLPPDARKWAIDLKSDPSDKKIEGSFDLIGSVIDPAQRTGVLIGWIDNPNFTLAVGQFITVTIDLPADAQTVAIPESALIEEGDNSYIFVRAAGNVLVRQRVDVARRLNGQVLIRILDGAGKPNAEELSALIGREVVVTGVVGLGGEFANLQAAAPSTR